MVGNKSIGPIAVFTASDFPYGGAAENFVRLMSAGLVKNDQEVRVFLFRGRKERTDHLNNDTGIPVSYVLYKNKPEIEIRKIFEIFFLFFATPLSLIKAKYQFKSRHILIYGIEYAYYLIPFIITCKLLNVKCIRIVTDKYLNSTIVPVWWKKPKLLFYSIQARYFDKYFDGMVFLSHYLKNQAVNNGVSKYRCTVIPHFIDNKQFNLEIKTDIGRKNTIRIGYCGTITYQNGLLVLLEAFDLALKSRDDLELMLIGDLSDYSGETHEKFQTLIRKNRENIILEGRVDYKEIASKLATCDILVNPRISGEWADAGFPTKLGEYLSAKKAVITTAVGDIPNYLKDGLQVILVPPDSPELLSEKICFLSNDRLLRDQLGLEGLNWVMDNLEYTSSAQKMIHFIQNLPN